MKSDKNGISFGGVPITKMLIDLKHIKRLLNNSIYTNNNQQTTI